MIPVQCFECQSGEKLETSAGETTGETMTLMMVATSALNIKVVENKRGETARLSLSPCGVCGGVSVMFVVVAVAVVVVVVCVRCGDVSKRYPFVHSKRPCAVPAPRAHVFQHVRVMLVHTWTF